MFIISQIYINMDKKHLIPLKKGVGIAIVKEIVRNYL